MFEERLGSPLLGAGREITMKPIFKEILQVAMVVKNVDESVKKYWDIFGIGPWEIHTMDSSNTHDMTVHGQPTQYAMRLAFSNLGSVQLELIEPLDDRSIYSEFLKKHGEGLHHIACSTDNFDESMSFFKGKGIGVLQEGTLKDGLNFVYLDTNETMSFITEIYNFPEDWKLPPPESVYP